MHTDNFLGILLIQTKFGLYFHFSDRFTLNLIPFGVESICILLNNLRLLYITLKSCSGIFIVIQFYDLLKLRIVLIKLISLQPVGKSIYTLEHFFFCLHLFVV